MAIDFKSLFIPLGAIVSAIIGGIITLLVSKRERKTKLDIQDKVMLEHQLASRDRMLDELRQQNIDLRDLKYELMLKIESLKHENDELQQNFNSSQTENVSLQEKILKLEEAAND